MPKWRGTGYYYSRYRPTLSHTLLFLVLLTAGAHRLVMQLNYNRDIQRIRYFERAARVSAGSKSPATGEKDQGAGAKAARRRKVKVPMVEGRDNTGYLDLIVVGDEVFLVRATLIVSVGSADGTAERGRNGIAAVKPDHSAIILPHLAIHTISLPRAQSRVVPTTICSGFASQAASGGFG